MPPRPNARRSRGPLCRDWGKGKGKGKGKARQGKSVQAALSPVVDLVRM